MPHYRNIVILTGAGISAESGLPTFRDKDGLWEGHEVEKVATPEGFQNDPDLVHRFYNERRKDAKGVKPNAAHKALARLEKDHKGDVTIITQNIDNLHELAGAKNVLHMHGEILKARCRHCNEVFNWPGDTSDDQACAKCHEKPALRPHIVWFNEEPFCMDDIEIALYTADLFISIGTSGAVYPAAGFISIIRSLGKAHSVELNLEPSEGQSLFAETHYGQATKIVPGYVDKLLKIGT